MAADAASGQVYFEHLVGKLYVDVLLATIGALQSGRHRWDQEPAKWIRNLATVVPCYLKGVYRDAGPQKVRRWGRKSGRSLAAIMHACTCMEMFACMYECMYKLMYLFMRMYA